MLRLIVSFTCLTWFCACGNRAAPDENPGLGGKADELSDVSASGDGIQSDAGPAVDPFALAVDVNLHHVVFPEELAAPAYQPAQTDSGFYLSGTEFWQKWSGGHNPTYSYSEGTEYGRRCMFASARRFEAIMSNAPEELVALKNDSNWGGSFYNWNDDYSNPDAWGDGSSARLWAWRTSLVKWISQTNKDGSCYLPTLDMVKDLAADCAEEAAASEGEIQGCRTP